MRAVRRKVYIRTSWLTHTRSKLPANRVRLLWSICIPLGIKAPRRRMTATVEEKCRKNLESFQRTALPAPRYFMKSFFAAIICSKQFMFRQDFCRLRRFCRLFSSGNVKLIAMIWNVVELTVTICFVQYFLKTIDIRFTYLKR